MTTQVALNTGVKPSQAVAKKIGEFLKKFQPYEVRSGGKVCNFIDERSGAWYVTCHIEGRILAKSCDTDATLGGDDEGEIYRLNREITEDPTAYRTMEKDAILGRSFEDIVIEYDTSYRPTKPLKVYGGQHRVRAITKAVEQKGNVLHGVRVYFDLTREQKVEIAMVSNTAIAVPNDLLDRMREQLLGPELRAWCQKTGLLDEEEDFADRRSPDVPTVRIARTIIVNYHLGKNALQIDDFHEPILCRSGGVDEDYISVRKTIDWADVNMLEAGKQFARLHKLQKKAVTKRQKDAYAEYARKALSLSIVAGWAYAAGLFQRESKYLEILYSIPDNVTGSDDPLNAKALSQARLQGVDPDVYRGLGTRTGPKELGRLLELFLVLAKKGKARITKDVANAAIQCYEAKKVNQRAKKAFERA